LLSCLQCSRKCKAHDMHPQNLPTQTHTVACTHRQACAPSDFLHIVVFVDHKVCTPGAERDSVCTTSGASTDCFCSPGCKKVHDVT
jgi:hypothetical protein